MGLNVSKFGKKLHRGFYGGEEVGVFFVGFELGELFFDGVGGVEEEAGVGFGEHRGVIEGIAGGNDFVV